MSNSLKPDANLSCERCGTFGAYAFDGHALCLDCYQQRGACCAEFGEPEESETRTAKRPPIAAKTGAADGR